MPPDSILSTPGLQHFIENLKAQCDFLAHAIEQTDESTPSWLAKDVLMLKKQSGALRMAMERVKRKLTENPAGNGTNASDLDDAAQTSDTFYPPPKRSRRTGSPGTRKRLSLTKGDEVGRPDTDTMQEPPSESNEATDASESQSEQSQSEDPLSSQPPSDAVEEDDDDDTIRFEDITAEVQRRLREKRVKEMMESPSSARKRKWDEVELEGAGRETEDPGVMGKDTGQVIPVRGNADGPQKKMRHHGPAQTQKRKDWDERGGGAAERRKKMRR